MGGVNYVVTFWKTYSYASVDYFHPCNNNQNTPYVGVPYNIFGFQNSQEGIAYAGIYTFNRSSSSFRDYLVVELTDTIIKGIPYLITFYISPADKVKYGIYHVGAYLSAEPPGFSQNNLFTQIPQIENKPENLLNDTSSWVMVADTFISNIGGEKFISIGNFRSDENTDTVSYNFGSNYYSVSYYYVDNVWVTPLVDVGIKENEQNNFSVYPNPNNGQMVLEYDLGKLPGAYLVINNIYGQVVFNYYLKEGRNRIEINLNQFAGGLYMARINSNEKTLYKEKIIIVK